MHTVICFTSLVIVCTAKGRTSSLPKGKLESTDLGHLEFAEKQAATGEVSAQRRISLPIRKRYSSTLTGCVSTSTTNRRAKVKMRCRRSDDWIGVSEKKKSVRR